MAYREVSRVEITGIVRQWQAGRGIREITRSTGLARNTIRKCLLTTLPERLALARRGRLDYASFLQILLADEVTRRNNRNLEIHLHAAGFEEVCRLEDFGLQKLTSQQSTGLYELVIAGLAVSGFVITTNRSVEEWLGLFDDPILGKSALDAWPMPATGRGYPHTAERRR